MGDETPRFAAKYVSRRMFLVSERDRSICVADRPGVKTCWQGVWIPKGALFDKSFTLLDPETGEIEFMVKQSFINKTPGLQ